MGAVALAVQIAVVAAPTPAPCAVARRALRRRAVELALPLLKGQAQPSPCTRHPAIKKLLQDAAVEMLAGGRPKPSRALRLWLWCEAHPPA